MANYAIVTYALLMNGLVNINAAIATQLLLSFFKVIGVVHYGTAGGGNPSLNVGDATIPQYWAHLALWSWQVFTFLSLYTEFGLTEHYSANVNRHQV